MLAAWYYAVNTGDRGRVCSPLWLSALQRVMNYMLDQMLMNATGIVTNTLYCDGIANESCASNWLVGWL